MSCTDCYNGCPDIISDKCVKYTGIDFPILGIENGDSLSVVEQALVTFLISALDGTGIKLDISRDDMCTLITDNLPDCTDLNALDLFKALIAAACSLQTQVTVNTDAITEINTALTSTCVDIEINDTLNMVVQKILTKLCVVDTALTALALNVSTNYVALADLNALIQAYLDSISAGTQQYTKMIPYTVMEYYGSLSNFDGGGVGLFSAGFDKIYLCNGQNGTPDKRGRSSIGVTTVPGGGAFNPNVDPGLGNPAYVLGGIGGTNFVTLSALQIAAHTHVATVTDPGHTHAGVALLSSDIDRGNQSSLFSIDNLGNTASAITGITVSNASAGGGQSHPNTHPVLACFFIMYIP